MADSKPPPTDKAGLRRFMRAMRRDLPDQAERSRSIWRQVEALEEVTGSGRILAYTSIPGEPDTAPFIAWAVDQGKQVAVPEDRIDPVWPDVVIVPGIAFTRDGERLGQGGGWFDRFLAAARSDCHTIGVAFAEQIVDVLPTEPHDVRLDRLITDRPPLEAR